MNSAELAILVLVGTGAIAGLVLYVLWPEKPPLPPEEALRFFFVLVCHVSSTSGPVDFQASGQLILLNSVYYFAPAPAKALPGLILTDSPS